jgi:hypothetical protein
MMLDLRQEAARLATELTDMPGQTGLPGLTAHEREAAIRTWRGRMVNEHISARVFGVLLGQSMAAGVSARRQTELAEFAMEELRHARQCASVVHALGGDAQAPMPELPEVPLHADAGPLEALLRNVLSVCCLSETVAVSLIRSETLEIAPPSLKKLLDAILADESGHARFGWSLLEEMAPLDADLAARLSEYLPVALDHLVRHELAHLPAHDGLGQAAADVGVCSGVAARHLLRDTIETVIVPGLERYGLAAHAAWRQVQGRAVV